MQMPPGKTRNILFLFLMGLVLAGFFCSKTEYPDGLYAELHTSKGLIVLSLEFDKTPMTVAHFVGLAEGTIKNDALPEGAPFYDGSKFHRVVPGHVIQAGVPDTEKEGSLGYMFPNEIHPELSHDRAGMLGVANGGPHTNGSQFYITLGDRSYLDADYTVFGEVIQGMDVVSAIVQNDVIQSVKIIRKGRPAKSFRSDTEAFQQLMARVKKRVEEQEIEKQKREESIIKSRWPGAIEQESGIKYMTVTQGKNEVPPAGLKVRVRYSGEVLNGKKFFSTSAGMPKGDPPAEEFIMEIGEKIINQGFDRALGQMRVGEKRVLILSSEMAYGIGGFYAEEVKGKKRFVISPNSTLIYEVELLGILP
jgi:peptidylprolyl isomerase